MLLALLVPLAVLVMAAVAVVAVGALHLLGAPGFARACDCHDRFPLTACRCAILNSDQTCLNNIIATFAKANTTAAAPATTTATAAHHRSSSNSSTTMSGNSSTHSGRHVAAAVAPSNSTEVELAREEFASAFRCVCPAGWPSIASPAVPIAVC